MREIVLAVELRHADVHQHDVGPVEVDRAEHLAAVGGLGHHLEARRAGEHHPQAGAHERVIVDEQDADHRGRRARRTKAPSGSTPCSSSPPASVTRSASPIRPVPAPGSGVPEATATGARLRTSTCRSPSGALDGERHGRSRRVLARVGQTLLHDPVRGAADGGGRRRVAQLDLCGDPHPGRPRLLDEGGEVGERRLGWLRQPLAAVLAQDADHAAQLVERGPRALADHAGRFGDLLGRSIGVELERAGVDGEQREAVGEHVVHLARDPPPLGLARIVGGAVGLLAHRSHELPAARARRAPSRARRPPTPGRPRTRARGSEGPGRAAGS